MRIFTYKLATYLSTGDVIGLFIYLFILSIEHELNVDKSCGSTTRFAKHLQHKTDQLNVKNLEKSTNLSEFLKLSNVLFVALVWSVGCALEFLGRIAFLRCITSITDRRTLTYILHLVLKISKKNNYTVLKLFILWIVQTTAEGTSFSGCTSMALCDLRYVAL